MTSTALLQWILFRPSVQFSHSVVSDSLRPHESQHARPPCPSPTPRVHSDSRPSNPWCPAISSSVIPFSSCPQSLPASESFPMSQLFTWGGQSTGASAFASFLPKKSQGWSPSEWTGWISLQSKGLSRVFSNTTVQKHILYHLLIALEAVDYVLFLAFIPYILGVPSISMVIFFSVSFTDLILHYSAFSCWSSPSPLIAWVLGAFFCSLYIPFVKWKKVKVNVVQSCLILCNPMDYKVHGILQARILEWVAFPFSRGSSQPGTRTQVSCIAGEFFTSWTTREALV